MCKRLFFIFLLIFTGFNLRSVFSEEENIAITEGEFAILFVQARGLEEELPSPPNIDDYILLLERYGLEPIDGWQVKRPLTRGRLATILLQSMAIEHKIINDSEACFLNVLRINQKWYSRFKWDKHWVELEKFLDSSTDFSQGRPRCPFGISYEDKDNNHLVEMHIHPSIEEVERAYIGLLGQRDMTLLMKRLASRYYL